MGALTHNGEVLQSLPANASQINFDKTGTNLNSTQTENAIKEVNTKVNTNTDDITQLKSGLTNLLKYVDITVTDTITLTANIVAYCDYPQTGIPNGSALIGVRLLSTTGDALDGNVGAYLGAFNFIHLLSTINKSFTSITFRIYFYGGS